ncbi:MAG: pilus assembly protein [Comamonadaceae bacterium]|nr:MAG: pilus assembly protein [Comamonadaceae bacterium]
MQAFIDIRPTLASADAMGTWLPAAFAALAAVCVVVGVYSVTQRMLQRYRALYSATAEAGFGEVFLFISAQQVWQVSMVGCVIVGAAAVAMTGNLYIAALSAILFLRLPRWLIGHLRARRLRRLESQLPEALRTMAGGLRSGASLAVVMRHMTVHVDVPLNQELELIQREQRVGVTFVDAMQHMEQRLQSESVSLLCASLRVATHTGGNLSETLDSVARTIERRTQMTERVRTLTAQGRLQAVIVGALPPVLLIALSVVAPQDMAPFWYTHEGWAVLTALAVMETAGFLMIWRIVDVEI